MLVEMVWRMIRWQPGYTALQKWATVLNSPTPNPAAKKKAVVAIARQLAVDLWRVFTGQNYRRNLLRSRACLRFLPTIRTSSRQHLRGHRSRLERYH